MLPELARTMADAAQQITVAQEQYDAGIAAWHHRVEVRTRRSARALAQLRFGELLRGMGIEYGPELEQVEVTVGDGTSPWDYGIQLQGVLFELGGQGALVVRRPGPLTDGTTGWLVADMGELAVALDRLAAP